jgi:hypothetical protein
MGKLKGGLAKYMAAKKAAASKAPAKSKMHPAKRAAKAMAARK